MHHMKPIIISQTGKKRPGKGFSPDEVEEAGLDANAARRLHIPIDRKRKSSHEENIECLKAHMKNALSKSAAEASKKKSKN